MALRESIQVLPAASVADDAALACAHCGAGCPDDRIASAGHVFCCHGCRIVFDLLQESGLGRFYTLEQTPGIRMADAAGPGRFGYLDDPAVRVGVVDYADDRRVRVTFQVPAIHCIACVWLLENLFRLNPAIGGAQVNFPRKEVALTFDPGRIALSGVVELLASLGYEPTLNLGMLRAQPPGTGADRRLWLKIGLAGFAFGNIMLLSFPSYLGLHAGDSFRPFFGWLSFGLALPVLLYSASDYWRAAWLGLRRRILTIDVPIALGIAALFGQSLYDVATRSGEGFFDSFSGLIFFLLCGRWFQQKSFDALSFDRDYRSYFPLSAVRREADGDRAVPLTALRAGDRLLVRNREIVPADARLVAGPALIDYSFVTGEAEPVARQPGDCLYAGGRQMGAAIELEALKETSQSYLTSLWNHEAFRKSRDTSLHNGTNRAGRWFTAAVLLLAFAAAGWWALRDASMAVRVFSATLIVACPCALALAAPFTLGAAVRLLGRNRFYLKNADVVEALARSDTLVFDKTGTLTHGAAALRYEGVPLADGDARAVRALAAHSTHPMSRSILGQAGDGPLPPVTGFREADGRGVSGEVAGRSVLLGSPAWLAEHGVAAPAAQEAGGSRAAVAIDRAFMGCFVAAPSYRMDIASLAAQLAATHRLALLSGDHDGERPRFRAWFGEQADLRFGQSPGDKLDAVRDFQQAGRSVAMIGDGLNDAGALRQSQVGIAVTDQVSSFSPACDAILDADAVGRLPALLRFSRAAMGVVYASFAISLAYNAVGLTFAARGALSPMISAILMPVSSVTVVAFALVMTRWAAVRSGLS